MSDPSSGIVVGVEDKSQSRREVTVTTGLVGLHRLTLMPGVLGTEDGARFIALASDLRAVAFDTPRRSAKRGG